ncbi:hypothetical protein ACFWUU_05425 [Kribbella sp. NPDC058693]|uniref:hypothetical protein n=1 Tax=Kribbella sp. NPDC058693 TaxID=3346602 RepID=UPI00364B3983
MWVAAAAAALIVVLFVLLHELSSSLGRIEVPELPARSISSVRSTFDLGEAKSRSQQAWCLWRSYSQPQNAEAPTTGPSGTDSETALGNNAATCMDAFSNRSSRVPDPGDGTGARLVRWYVGLHLLLLIIYVTLAFHLIRLLRRRTREGLESSKGAPDPGRHRAHQALGHGLCEATKPGALAVLFGGLLIAELAEAVARWIVGSPGASRSLVNAAGIVLAIAPPAKLISLATLGLLLVLLCAWPHIKDPGEADGRTVTTDQGPRGETPDDAHAARQHLGTRQIWSLLRLQVVASGLFVVLFTGLGQNQIVDALLRWGDWADTHSDTRANLLSVSTLLISLAAALGFSLLLWRSAQVVALSPEETIDCPPPLAVAGAALICLIAAAFGWRNLGGLGICLAGIALLSAFAGAPPWRWGNEEPMMHDLPATQEGYTTTKAKVADRARMPDEDSQLRVSRVARWIAALPLAAIGVSATGAAFPPLVVLGSPTAAGGGRLLMLVILGLGLLAAAVALPFVLESRDRSHVTAKVMSRRPRTYLIVTGAAAVAYLMALVPATRQAFPILVGPVGLIALFLSAVLLVGTELQRISDRVVPVAGLRALAVTRTPVLRILIAWFIIGSLLDTTGHHPVRTEESTTAPVLTVERAFDIWRAANCAVGAPNHEPAELPMVFIAAQGGGIRAAYWTAGVLDQLFPTTTATTKCTSRASQVFALSGASGGSVGIMSWLNAPSAHRPWYQHAPTGDQIKWYDKSLAVDHLSSLTSWMLYADVPRSMLGYGGPDRAALLEESLEHSQPALADPFLEGYRPMTTATTNAWRPLALLNGTAVESGCRALTAPVQLTDLDTGNTPSTFGCRSVPSSGSDAGRTASTGLYDLTDLYLCPSRDLAMSTAATLSARFPYVTPSGRLSNCDNNQVRTFVVDGGYLDNSGAMTATDIYERLLPRIRSHNELYEICKIGCSTIAQTRRPARKIRPVFVQIDNGYGTVARSTGSGRAHELIVPPVTRLAVAQTVEQAARQRSYEAFGSRSFFRIANAPHPGVQAPLGWAMSDTARDELCRELDVVTPDLVNLATTVGAVKPQVRHC